MNSPLPSRSCATSFVTLLAILSIAIPLSATAQQETPPETGSASIGLEPALPVQLRIGDATRSLLAMQREGNVASTTPRPLAGDVASLSYQRYLDSFRFPIPEKFSTTVQKSGSGGSGAR